MTDNITPIQAPKKVQYCNGFAKCISCKHEWKFRAPVGTVWLECPACHLEMGRMRGPFEPEEGDYYWNCGCGNNLFFITPKDVLCPCCGKTHVFS